MIVDCISDIHCSTPNLTGGDLLIISGDISYRGTIRELVEFNTWLSTLDYAKIVMIAGNHDFLFEKDNALARRLITNAEYLENSCTIYQGLHIWGSPVSPWFHDWAFNRHRGPDIKRYWDMIPDDTDILITHGPPMGILDTVAPGREHLGCQDLLEAVTRVKPLYHMFGHIHGGYGTHEIIWSDTKRTKFINSSIMDENYEPLNYPIRIIY